MGTLCLTQLSCGYDHQPVVTVDRLSLDAGDRLSVVGLNGSGKSTLLRTLCGLLPPMAGEVTWKGGALLSMSPVQRSRHVTMLLQMQDLDAAMTVEELVSLGRTPWLKRFSGLSRTDRECVAQVMDLCDVTGLRDRPLHRISGGERQRARLAMVLAQQTDVVLLDEPLNHLDVPHRHRLHDVIERVRRERGCVVVLVCHSIEDARRFSDRILLLRNGTTEMYPICEFEALRDRLIGDTGVPGDWVY